MGNESSNQKPGAGNVFILRRKHVVLTVGLLLLAAAFLLYMQREDAESVTGAAGGERVYHMVTGEFKTTTADGKVLEAYRWDPGTIYIKKGEKVKLSIYGVNGASHPFIIEGLNIKGEVKKGQETIVTFKADKEGTYRIICLTHPDIASNGPMIGYIVVD